MNEYTETFEKRYKVTLTDLQAGACQIHEVNSKELLDMFTGPLKDIIAQEMDNWKFRFTLCSEHKSLIILRQWDKRTYEKMKQEEEELPF